ncbi:MAG TPA: hypothetical protein PLP31_14660 [Thermoanaerobaculaceae bacterium]|nr:hypothetical protein [Thermoanaerobaculaceae bacterium]
MRLPPASCGDWWRASWIATDEMSARALYKDFYCARGDMDNRIKRQPLGLFADRPTTALRSRLFPRWYCPAHAFTDTFHSLIARLIVASPIRKHSLCSFT